LQVERPVFEALPRNRPLSADPRTFSGGTMVKRTLLALGAGVLLATLAPVSSQAAMSPIHISQCFVTVPKAMSKKASGTQIVYTNTSRKGATHITFAVGYRNAESNYLRRVTDDGNFAPGVQINHHFALYNDVTFAGKTTRSCSAVSVKYADGTSWSI